MTNRYVLEGNYHGNHTRKTSPKANPKRSHHNNKYNEKYPEVVSEPHTWLKSKKIYANMVIDYLWMPCNKLPKWVGSNYLAIMLVLVVLVFSILLPDISHKLHKNNELKSIKNVLDRMQEEVKRAEVACLTANEEVCSLHCALCDEGTAMTEETCILSVSTSRGLHTTKSAPGGVEKTVRYFSRFISFSPSTSKKEITLMSVVYTDSFDSQKKVEEIVA